MNELIISLKVNSDGSATIQQVTGGLGGMRQEAGATGQALTRLSTDAGSAGAAVRQALEFAGITVGLTILASKVREFTGEVMTLGARTEMIRGAAYAVGQYYQVSGQAIDYYVGKLKDANITEQNAFYGVTKFLAGGLNLELIPALAEAAKNLAPLAPEGKTVNEEFKGLVTTISSGMPRGLKEFGVQMGNVLGDAGRSMKQLNDEMSLTGPERAQATLAFVLAYSKQVQNVGVETADAYARQQGRLVVEAERAKEALFEVFRPIGEAVIGEKIQAWQDLYGVIARNKTELIAAAQAVGVFVGNVADGVKSVMLFAGAHKELLGAFLELYGFYKMASWIMPYIAATNAAAVANATLAASQTTAAATATLAAAAQTTGGLAATAAAPQVLYLANAYGAVTGTASLAAPALTGAGAAAATSGTLATSAIAGWTGLAGSIKLALIALAAYGAYKTFKEPGQLTGPESSGDPFADVAAGSNRRGVAEAQRQGEFGGYETPMGQQQEGFKIKKVLTEEEIQAEIDAAVKKRVDAAKTKKPPLKGKGGGGAGEGSEAADRSLENFVQTMKAESARASGEGMAVLDQWKAKGEQTLEELAAKGVDVTKGREALDEAYYYKKAKLDEDFNQLVAKESGNAFAEIDAKYRQDLQKYGDTEEKKAQLYEIWQDQTTVQDLKNDQERLGRQQDYLGKMAQYAPLLSQQLDLQRQLLGVEDEQARNKLDLDLATHKIDLEEWHQLEALRAQTVQMALQAQLRKDWQTQGVGGGFKMAALGYAQESQTYLANQTVAAIKSAEDFVGKTLGDTLVNTLQHKKTSLAAIGKDMGESFLKWAVKGLAHLGFAALLGGGGGGAGGGASAAGGLASAAGGLAGLGKSLVSGIKGLLGGGSGQTSKAMEEGWKELQTGAEMLTDGSGDLITGATDFGANLITDGANLVEDALINTEDLMAGVGLTTAAIDLTLAATALEAAATELMSAAFASVAPFHGGGLVAHAGLLVAHNGLAPDERLVKVLTGEPILRREAMAAYTRQGITFDDLNNARLPAVPVAVGEGNFPGAGGGTQVIHISIGDIHLPLTAERELTPQEADRLVRTRILPALEKNLGRFGRGLLG